MGRLSSCGRPYRNDAGHLAEGPGTDSCARTSAAVSAVGNLGGESGTKYPHRNFGRPSGLGRRHRPGPQTQTSSDALFYLDLALAPSGPLRPSWDVEG